MKIEVDEQCPDCGGTGLYIGMAERDRGIVGGNNHEAWHVNWLMDPIRFPELVVGWLKEGTKK